MADLNVGEELQDYLVAQGIAQLPATPLSPTVPVVILAPRDGVAELRDGENAAITIVEANVAAPHGLEAWIEEAFVDVFVRARANGACKLIQRQIRGLLHPNGDHGGRKLWMMSDLLVEYSTMWRGDQPYDQDTRTYTRVQGFRFGCRRKALAGQPYAP